MASTLGSEVLTQRQHAFESLRMKRILWDNAEKLFHNQLNDLNSSESQSKVFDPKLSTLTIERGYRVMSQLAQGKVKGLSSIDVGDAKVKNLLLDNYVIPNATAQFDFLTKLRMIDIYSNLYGNFFALIDQDIKPNGYTGPDIWMLNIRDVFPQVGAVSLDDSDYVIVRTWKPLSYFEGLKPTDGFKNIPQIVAKLKALSGSKQNRDSSNMSKREEDQYPRTAPAKEKGFFEVLTRFERDRWVDICVDADGLEFRDQKNPHDDGSLPVECKYSIPLLDDFMGMGDFERGGPMQMTINSIWNLYLDATKMSIFPPIIINKDNVASPSSFEPLPGAQWLGRGQVGNIAQAVNLNPQGIATFNNTYQVANAAIQSLFGTSETNVSEHVDNSMGKTPQALQMQQQRENTRDNADRFYMEQFISKVMKRFVNLMSKNQSATVSFRMFPEEIDKLTREYPELANQYDTKTGKFSAKTGKKAALYDWEIVSGSTYAQDQHDQQQNLQQLLQMWMQSNGPQGNMLEQQLNKDGYNLKFGELFKRIVAMSGIQDWDKILEEMTPQEHGQHIMDNHAKQFQNVLQQIQGNPSSVPAIPGGQMPPMPQGMPGQPGQMPMGQPSGLPPQLAGLRPGGGQPPPPPPPPKQPSETLNYKDAPEDIKRQIEAQAGLSPSQLPPPIVPGQTPPLPPQMGGSGILT